MKLSIITINRNNAAGLRKTIENVMEQTFTDIEYICTIQRFNNSTLQRFTNNMSKKETVTIKGNEIVFYKKEQEDYISLTDIAKVRDADNPSQIISLWLRTYSTIEYLGLWEMLNNSDFKPHIYEGFKNESAKPHFWMSPLKWITETNAKGMMSKAGRYGGGTFAHSDIAFKYTLPLVS